MSCKTLLLYSGFKYNPVSLLCRTLLLHRMFKCNPQLHTLCEENRNTCPECRVHTVCRIPLYHPPRLEGPAACCKSAVEGNQVQ